MKKYLILNIILVIAIVNLYGQDRRQILGMPGPPSTSNLWDSYINQLGSLPPPAYKVEPLFDLGVYSYNSTINTNVNNWINALNVYESQGKNVENVLGLGHDVGGLVLRGLSNDDRITANILIGVPNRGSNILKEIILNDASELNDYIAKLVAARGGVVCDDCSKVTLLDRMIKEMQVNENLLKGGATAPLTGYYNNAPIHENTVVIWGNAGNGGIHSLLGSNSFLGNVDLVACQKNKKAIWMKETRKLERLRVISRITGIVNIVSSLFSITVPIKDENGKVTGNQIDPLKGFSTILSIANGIKADMEATSRIRDEIRKQLICDIFDNALEAAWKLTIADGKVEWFTTPPNPIECEKWWEMYPQGVVNTPCTDPDPRVCEYDIYCPSCWDEYNLYCNGTQYSQLEPSDLLYTRTEQTIEGHQPTYEIFAAHGQEQSWSFNGSVTFPIFDGSLGAAYQIPK
jgi:hypothetical protein